MHKSMTHVIANKSIILPDIAKSNETIDHVVAFSTNEEYKNTYHLATDHKLDRNSRQMHIISFFAFCSGLVQTDNF